MPSASHRNVASEGGVPVIPLLQALRGRQTWPSPRESHKRLPSDMARAAPKTYRSIRSEGVASLRQWILEQYPIQQRSGPELGHSFQSCCQADFLLAGASTEAELFALLNGSDQLEILLRDVGAFIYERRTGDRVGGAHMRVLNVPGPNADILPDWTIN